MSQNNISERYTYQDIITDARQNYHDGVDVVYLPHAEFIEFRKCLLNHLDTGFFKHSTTTNIPDDTIVFLGVTYQKQD